MAYFAVIFSNRKEIKMKPTIDTNIPCVIVPKATGILYGNQVGGYACHQLEIEGYIIPLESKSYVKVKEGEKSNNDNPYWNIYDVQEQLDKLFAPINGSKYKGHCYKGIDEDDALYIENLFKDNFFMSLEVDRDNLGKCEEAKVFVKVTLAQYDFNHNSIEPFVVEGVLTWKNSD